ncbi:MAG: ferric reductase-like transmembrane domain-containing protein [Ferrovibrio sp.]
MPPALLIAGYILLTLAPLALAWAQGKPPRAFVDELSSGLALAAFAVLLMEFLLSGRFRSISERIGMDVTMRFHQLLARVAAAFILVHPFLYSTPLGLARPDDVTQQGHLGLTGAAAYSGIIGWLLLLLLVVTAMRRTQIGHSYERWRVSHAIGAVLIAALVAHHAFAAGRYSGEGPLLWFWILLLALAALTMLAVYVIRPLLRLRRPYEVVAVTPVAPQTWQLEIKPRHGEVMTYDAGQFVWLRVGRNPWSPDEHPFSLASAPADRTKLSFIIKAFGDFTSKLGGVAPGTVAYVDGPYGHLTLARRKAEGVALLAGGAGIAPLLGILRQMQLSGDRRPVVLVYGNRSRTQIVLADELEALAGSLNLKVVHVLSEPDAGWTGRRGMLDEALLGEVFGFDGADRWCYLLCGPQGMMESCERSLLGLNIPAQQIVSERFYYD